MFRAAQVQAFFSIQLPLFAFILTVVAASTSLLVLPISTSSDHQVFSIVLFPQILFSISPIHLSAFSHLQLSSLASQLHLSSSSLHPLFSTYPLLLFSFVLLPTSSCYLLLTFGDHLPIFLTLTSQAQLHAPSWSFLLLPFTYVLLLASFSIQILSSISPLLHFSYVPPLLSSCLLLPFEFFLSPLILFSSTLLIVFIHLYSWLVQPLSLAFQLLPPTSYVHLLTSSISILESTSLLISVITYLFNLN